MRPEPRILVVEDNPEIRRHLVRRIEKAGFSNVEEAIDGEYAFQQLDAMSPDLVISDLQMPTLDGLELLKRMRATPSYAGIPFVLMSGNMSDDIKAEALSLGATACIHKPEMRDATLLEVIKKALGPK